MEASQKEKMNRVSTRERKRTDFEKTKSNRTRTTFLKVKLNRIETELIFKKVIE
jgi:hypothetical protein